MLNTRDNASNYLTSNYLAAYLKQCVLCVYTYIYICRSIFMPIPRHTRTALPIPIPIPLPVRAFF